MRDQKANILVIEDEKSLVMTLQDRLEAEGYHVSFALDGASGFVQATKGNCDVIILDLMLPKKGGLDICRDLRKLGVQTPIIMLTARGQVIDKVLGLKLGADDYMEKPFDMMELLARIEVQLRKLKTSDLANDPITITFGDIKANFKKGNVTKKGLPLTLSSKEFKLLKFMVQNEGIILSRDQLLNEVWGYDAVPSTRTVDVHVSWLRQKLEPDPRYPRHIITVHGFGYKFMS